MKNLLLALAVCLSAIPAFAGNDGPNAAQSPREARTAQVIAQVDVGIFFAPPDYPRRISVSVDSKGIVKQTKVYRDKKVEVEVIAKLSKSVTAKLQANVNSVSKGEVTDLNPEAAECMDAPTTTYSAVVDGKLEMIEQKKACKKYGKQEANDADHQVVRTLEGLMDVASIREPGKY